MHSEAKNLLIDTHARGREDVLVEAYIEHGPTELRENLALNAEQWEILFDYLVFEHALLYKAIVANSDFFLEEYVNHGMAHLRGIFDVSEDKYTEIWSVVFDFVAISNGGLLLHVMEHRDRYVGALRQHGGQFVRKILGLGKDKYEANWKEVLDFLLHAVCDSIFSQNTFDHGLRAFSQIMNASREHRKIFRSGLL